MNRVKLLTIVVLLGLIPQFAFADKIPLSYRKNEIAKKKQHPAEQYLSSIKKDSQILKTDRHRDKTYNKLLIILVGFQEEIVDDPNTTGNGQFILQAPENYPIQLSKPPHDQEYYDKMALAMRYYYLAASLGGFDLEWDIYPQDKACYTLSQPMGYYNPPGASNQEFVAKMEEYFKESFETADQESPEIQFSNYSHYMIIHAGSDWQHDVLADTPSDIPSFFIRVGDGKEAVVDGGSHIIDYACNIPETITQDISEYDFGDGNIQVSGYGALNGVMFHEFGHSLGLVDLYAVNSYYPMVGSFDIMDSGGSTEVGMGSGIDDKTYSIEGIIPGLPGAFSRVLMFEDSFRQRGILKDIEDLTKLQDIRITCAEERYDLTKAPYIYKLQISEDEYILIENRNVDPDGDGGTAVFSALDGRIALHPTAYQDDDNNPTFEYDYLLPSFIDQNVNAIGGGLLVWKVNDDVLYNQGSYDSQGNFVSNFANNFINTRYSKRGVEIIEADAIPDIGNVYAYNWKGTAFEYYFKHIPSFETINGDDFFAGWSDRIHNDVLNASSTPPLVTSSGFAHTSGLYNISQSGKEMTFSYGSPILNRTTSITSEREIITISPIFDGTTKLSDIALVSNNSIDLYYFDKAEHDFESFSSIDLDHVIDDYQIIHPLQKVDFDNDDNDELVLFYSSKMLVLRNNIAHTFELNTMVNEMPQFFDNKYYVKTDNKVLEIKYHTSDNSIEITEMDYQVDHIIASETDLFFITNDLLIDLTANISLDLPGNINTKPVILNHYTENQTDQVYKTDQFLIMKTSDNVIYSYNKTDLQVVYDYSATLADQPTSQLALNNDDQDVYLVFTSGNSVYANYIDGTFPLNFPRTFHNYDFTQDELLIIDNSYLNNQESSYYGKTIYLPVEENNYLAWNLNQDTIDPALSLIDNSNSRIFSHYKSEDGDSLGYFFQITSFDNSVILQWTEKKNLVNPLNWEVNNYNPNRNLNHLKQTSSNEDNNQSISAYVFPNPVAGNQATLRIFNIKKEAKVKIYDIAGKLIKSYVIESNDLDHVDSLIDFSQVASGIYIGIIEENSTYKFKFAVTK
jgi:M6 family metalloprotease-like protein